MSKKIISTIKLIMCALKPICILLIQFNFFQERSGFHCKSEGGAGARSDRLKKKMNKCNEWKELFDIKGQSIDDYLRLALFENNFCSWNIFIEFHICFLGQIFQYISIISPYLLCDIYFWGHICLFWLNEELQEAKRRQKFTFCQLGRLDSRFNFVKRFRSSILLSAPRHLDSPRRQKVQKLLVHSFLGDFQLINFTILTTFQVSLI